MNSSKARHKNHFKVCVIWQNVYVLVFKSITNKTTYSDGHSVQLSYHTVWF